MGDVGDQLSLHPLGLNALVHGGVDGAAQVVKLFGVGAKVGKAFHAGGVDHGLRRAAHNGLGAPAELMPLLYPLADKE